MKTKIFYDLEATGVARTADPVSIGLVALTEEKFITDITENFFEEYKLITEKEWINKEDFDGIVPDENYDTFDDLLSSYPEFDNQIFHEEKIIGRENWGFQKEITVRYKLDKEITIEFIATYYDDAAHGNLNREICIERVSKIINNTYVKTFYAEFTDFDTNKADDWVKENIIGKLKFELNIHHVEDNDTILQGPTSKISNELKQWLSQFESIEFWADFDVIDKPMLIDLIAEWDIKEIVEEVHNGWGNHSYESWIKYKKHIKTGLPKHLPNIRYDQFFDLHTLFKIKGIDTDISRIEFIGDLIKEIPEGQGHNALYDSYVNWQVYNKLIKI